MCNDATISRDGKRIYFTESFRIQYLYYPAETLSSIIGHDSGILVLSKDGSKPLYYTINQSDTAANALDIPMAKAALDGRVYFGKFNPATTGLYSIKNPLLPFCSGE